MVQVLLGAAGLVLVVFLIGCCRGLWYLRGLSMVQLDAFRVLRDQERVRLGRRLTIAEMRRLADLCRRRLPRS